MAVRAGVEAGAEHEEGNPRWSPSAPLELDPATLTTSSRRWNRLVWDVPIVLEDFHYLPQEYKQTSQFGTENLP